MKLIIQWTYTVIITADMIIAMTFDFTIIGSTKSTANGDCNNCG